MTKLELLNSEGPILIAKKYKLNYISVSRNIYILEYNNNSCAMDEEQFIEFFSGTINAKFDNHIIDYLSYSESMRTSIDKFIKFIER